MKTTDRDLASPGAQDADEAPDALDRLLAEARVPVAEGFTRQVMSGLPEPDWRSREPSRAREPYGVRRSARGEWAIAAGLAAALIAVAAAVLAGSTGTASGVAGSVLDLLAATLSAGAGFVAASWRGLGQAVDAALDGSPTALAVLGLAVLAANVLLVLLLRRRRRATARTTDES
jgi:hypothetical protein